MSAFTDQIQKLQLQMKKKDQQTILTQLQKKQKLDSNLDQLLQEENINVKEETTINAFGMIVKKAVKVEKEFRFMTKFLDKFKFFKDLREGLPHELYNEMLKKIVWQAVEPNEFLFSKSNDKKKNKLTNNFCIIIEGEVIEFQQLEVEIDSYKQSINQSKTTTANNLEQSAHPSHSNLDSPIISDNHYVRKSNAEQGHAQNKKDKSFDKTHTNKSSNSVRNSPQNSPSSAMMIDSIKQLNLIDDSIKKVIEKSTPRNLSRQSSCAYLGMVEYEEENRFINSVNEYIESSKHDKHESNNSKWRNWKFLNITTKAINAFKKNISPLKNRQSSLFDNQKKDKKNKATPLLASKFSKNSLFKQNKRNDGSESDLDDQYSPYSQDTDINYDEDVEEKFLNQVTKHFKNMKLRKIMKQGDHFGEFDDGNLNLIAQGYMSRKKGYLVYLSSVNYNELIQKYQNQIIEKKIKFLQQLSFFRCYSKQKMRNYLKYFQNETYYRNNVVYQELDPANYIYFIISGEIEFSRLFKLENQVIPGQDSEEKLVPLSELNAQTFNITFNPFEKQEKEMYHLNQGKQFREKSQLIKRIRSFVLGANQYFGEKEILTNSYRLTQTKVQSVKLEVLQLPAQREYECFGLTKLQQIKINQIYYEQFYSAEIHSVCLEESQLREIEQLKIFEEIQSRYPIQNIVQKLEQDYLTNFVTNNSKQQHSYIDNMLSKIPPHVPFDILKKKDVKEVANFKDTYLNEKEFYELVSQEQLKKTNRYMREIRECKIQFLSKFMNYQSKFSSPKENLPFYDHVKTYVESVAKNKAIPNKQIQENKMRDMLSYCSPKQAHKTQNITQKSPIYINGKTSQTIFYAKTNQIEQNIQGNQLVQNNEHNQIEQSLQINQMEQTHQSNKMEQNDKKNYSKARNLTFSSGLSVKHKEQITISASPQSTPIMISQMHFSRKSNVSQAVRIHKLRKCTTSLQLNQEIQKLNQKSPTTIQFAKKQIQRNSFQSETPNSQATQTTRLKNSSLGSLFSNQVDQFTLFTSSDSCKDDQSIEPQINISNNGRILFLHGRRQTTPNIKDLQNYKNQ